MSRLVQPVLDGEVDVAHGSRVLGHADRNHFARELGIVFFNRLVSFITRTHVTDCSNGYRAVRTTVLPQLVLRQEQFHTSEFMIEAIKRGIPAKEIPITVEQRLHGHSKKPAVLPLWGRVRECDRADLAAVGALGGVATHLRSLVCGGGGTLRVLPAAGPRGGTLALARRSGVTAGGKTEPPALIACKGPEHRANPLIPRLQSFSELKARKSAAASAPPRFV